MTHGSLCSGIGGCDLAAKWCGWTNVFQCENNGFCQIVLKYYFKNTILHEDIKETDFTGYRGTIDVISGGFPCQPFSTAGTRKGTSDDRFLWPEMFRVIREVRPAWVVAENVCGLLSQED
jgi:DNA (cytosine-5)-methyltransferase 1